MGQLRFYVPPSLRSDLVLSETAYVCGIEGIPWECHVAWRGDCLTVTRPVDESGKLSIPWPVPGIGLVTLQTCSVRETETPYLLPLELARGSCYRLRGQADLWQRSGMKMPPEFSTRLERGTSLFLDAAQYQTDPEAASRYAQDALRHLEAAGDALVDGYSAQALAFRKSQETRLGTLTAASLMPPGPAGDASESVYLDAFNTVALRLNWTTVETDAGHFDFEPFDRLVAWCRSHGLRICAGPLFDFQAKLLPHYLYLFEDDFGGLLDAVAGFAERAVQRYRGQVNLWHCAAGLNTPGPLRLDEEQVMRLAVALIQTVRRHDPRTPLLISVDQPWAEYLARDRDGISPLHFIDALARSDLGLAGIGLEMRLDYWPGGSLPRTVFDVGQQIDRWAMLGLPLLVQLAVPAQDGNDPQAATNAIPVPAGPHNGPAGSVEYTTRLLRTLLAKQSVHGIFWDAWDDRRPHLMPHAGLIDAAGNTRPLAARWAALRRQFLT